MIYLNEYFSELRSRIDVDAEKILLRDTKTGSQNQAKQAQPDIEARVNELRSDFIRILKRMEDDLQEKLPVSLAAISTQVYAALGERVNEFRKRLDNGGSMKEHAQTYIQLVDEIFDQMSQLEAQLFRNQTIGYVNPEKKFGQLFYVEHGHLNKAELDALK